MDKRLTPKNKIIAIVPTHGAGQSFIDCIDSLASQTLPLTEIIIIDNNVKDNSIQTIQSKNLVTPIKIVTLKENTGVTGGRNAGIKSLPQDYDYVLFVDHDMIAESNMLNNLVRTSQNDTDIGIVTPKIYYWENKNIIWSAGTDVNLTTGQTIFYGGKDNSEHSVEREVAVAPAILLVKKAVIDAIHEFNPIYFATYEDTEFCFAAKKNGYKTFYSPKAVAYHKIPFNPEAAMHRLIERLYWVARNRIIFMKRYAPNYSLFLLFLPVFAIYYLILTIKYHKAKMYKEYIRGTLDGLKYNNV